VARRSSNALRPASRARRRRRRGVLAQGAGSPDRFTPGGAGSVRERSPSACGSGGAPGPSLRRRGPLVAQSGHRRERRAVVEDARVHHRADDDEVVTGLVDGDHLAVEAGERASRGMCISRAATDGPFRPSAPPIPWPPWPCGRTWPQSTGRSRQEVDVLAGCCAALEATAAPRLLLAAIHSRPCGSNAMPLASVGISMDRSAASSAIAGDSASEKIARGSTRIGWRSRGSSLAPLRAPSPPGSSTKSHGRGVGWLTFRRPGAARRAAGSAGTGPDRPCSGRRRSCPR
jgi:hypothetical protein